MVGPDHEVALEAGFLEKLKRPLCGGWIAELGPRLMSRLAGNEVETFEF